MTHSELVGKILSAARGLGLLAHSCRDGRKCDGAGFPDLMLAGPGGILFAEVKTGSGETTAEQDHWGWMISRRGGMWEVWREADWESGRIERELAELAE